MAKFIMLITSLFILNTQARELMIVSDLDDTIKITQVQSTSRTVFNGLFTRKIFAGMDKLLQMMEQYTCKTYVLTSSPSIISFNIYRLFRKFNLDIDELITRNIFKDRDSQKYKLKALEKIIKDNPQTKFILIGDNTDHDHLIYDKIAKKYPDIIEDIYMHKVRPGIIPSGQKVWFSALDIAYFEFKAKRLIESEFDEIYNILKNSKHKNIIPKKLFCPTSFNEWVSSKKSDVEYFRLEIIEKVINTCREMKRAEKVVLYSKG